MAVLVLTNLFFDKIRKFYFVSFIISCVAALLLDSLLAGASQFEASAGKLKRKFWWKNMKVGCPLDFHFTSPLDLLLLTMQLIILMSFVPFYMQVIALLVG